MTDEADPSMQRSVSPIEQGKEAASLLVWDADTEPPTWEGPIILWRTFHCSPGEQIFSLPEMVDRKARELRRKFLAFVYQIGVTRLGGKSIIDYLEIRPGLSYWWMTQIAQKDVYANSPHIYDAIKLFAFEELARSYNRRPVRLHSRKRELSLVIREWCQAEGRQFEWSRPDRNDNDGSLRRNVFRTLPSIIRALLTFSKFIVVRLPILLYSPRTKQPSQSDIAIFDSFSHLHGDSLSTKVFSSRYWSNFVTFLNDIKVSVNWFHLSYNHPAVPNLRAAISLASDFTRSADRQQHRIIDGQISLRLTAKVLMDFIRINKAGLAMKGIEQIFRPENSSLNLWQLFKRDWGGSIWGPNAVVSLFFLNIFEEQIRNTPHQKLGIYIQENQPWELALVQLWNTYGHGLLIGVPHTTVPFWDLRYGFDPRTFEIRKNGLPIPGLVALNSPNAISRFEESGYPMDRYREVEALRYLYLEKLGRNVAYEDSNDLRALRLLVLGDLLPEYTETQISFLEYCVDTPGFKLEVIFKPHPSAVTFHRKIGLPDLRISTRHISEELGVCDVVLVGSATSAAADAYQIGVPVISVNDGNRINLSPLYGAAGVTFVNSPDDLARALSNVDINRKRQYKAFFTVDETIPRWKSLVLDALRSKSK